MDIVVAVVTQDLDFINFTMVGESAFDSRTVGAFGPHEVGGARHHKRQHTGASGQRILGAKSLLRTPNAPDAPLLRVSRASKGFISHYNRTQIIFFC